MKALFIGGTGTISASISQLCVSQGWELYLLNRGNRSEAVPREAKILQADINDLQDVKEKLGEMRFDVVADFIAFTPQQVLRDIELFRDRTEQYFFISSASVFGGCWVTVIRARQRSAPACCPLMKRVSRH